MSSTKLLFAIVFACVSFVCAQRIQYAGVNLACAEFKDTVIPGTYGTDYTYPTEDEVDYWVKKGFNVFRIPFLWERMQATIGGALVSAELARLDKIVSYITDDKGRNVVIDPHNYARYYGDLVGTVVSANAFGNFWSQLATHYKGNGKVFFGIMNEPHDMDTNVWVTVANTAITSIRATGAVNKILVPGNAFTGAWSWTQSWYGTSNGQAMLGLRDSVNNTIIEVHQYLDTDSSGTTETCVNNGIGSERLQEFTLWCSENGFKAFLGEFGGGTSSTCLEAIDDMLSYVDKNLDVWVGWTYWAGGPWWGTDYFTAVTPIGGKDRPQTTILLKHVPNSDDPDKGAGAAVHYNLFAVVAAVVAVALYNN